MAAVGALVAKGVPVKYRIGAAAYGALVSYAGARTFMAGRRRKPKEPTA
jgi:hypothetical protein